MERDIVVNRRLNRCERAAGVAAYCVLLISFVIAAGPHILDASASASWPEQSTQTVEPTSIPAAADSSVDVPPRSYGEALTAVSLCVSLLCALVMLLIFRRHRTPTYHWLRPRALSSKLPNPGIGSRHYGHRYRIPRIRC